MAQQAQSHLQSESSDHGDRDTKSNASTDIVGQPITDAGSVFSLGTGASTVRAGPKAPPPEIMMPMRTLPNLHAVVTETMQALALRALQTFQYLPWEDDSRTLWDVARDAHWPHGQTTANIFDSLVTGSTPRIP
ncbi:unnamed protein product [Polarella glacialis]|uniref:Uncharacterized protein n=1 Tax=Polarella glacialis TaxID=89957 RepID=A0A813DVA8_POLGL|nr:unnamed protein product [Polarella glacialis]